MLESSKRFKSSSSVFDESQHPIPEPLKAALEMISQSYNSQRMRNLEIMDTSEQRLYGFITHYESNNFVWVQPTRSLNRDGDPMYHKYLKKINAEARSGKAPFYLASELKRGMDCIAQYESDGNWYRAMIVEEPESGVAERSWNVIFVDYGNFQQCNLYQIKPIFQDHFDFPLQAICCRLYNLVPKLPAYRTDIDLRLEQFYIKNSQRFLEIKVRNRRIDYIVDVNLFFCNHGKLSDNRLVGRHIAKDIVDDGLAVFAEPDMAFVKRPETIKSETVDIEDSEEDEDYKRKIKLIQEVKVKLEKSN